jgi:hypothetical protein
MKGITSQEDMAHIVALKEKHISIIGMKLEEHERKNVSIQRSSLWHDGLLAKKRKVT